MVTDKRELVRHILNKEVSHRKHQRYKGGDPSFVPFVLSMATFFVRASDGEVSPDRICPVR